MRQRKDKIVRLRDEGQRVMERPARGLKRWMETGVESEWREPFWNPGQSTHFDFPLEKTQQIHCKAP